MLQGTLDVLNFGDVLTIARRKRVTGTLRVRASQFNAMIHFSRGRWQASTAQACPAATWPPGPRRRPRCCSPRRTAPSSCSRWSTRWP